VGLRLLQPAISVSYLEDVANRYTAAAGNSVSDVTSRLGQAKVGPVISYRYQLPGLAIEPRVGLQVVWDFVASARANNLVATGSDHNGALRGRSEVGLRAAAPGGVTLDVSGSYDGIGIRSYSAITGTAAVRMPLN
jgi:hypothetical protein